MIFKARVQHANFEARVQQEKNRTVWILSRPYTVKWHRNRGTGLHEFLGVLGTEIEEATTYFWNLLSADRHEFRGRPYSI
jgi:hypothetical protein